MHVRERSQHVLSLGDDGGRTWSQEKHASAIRAGPRRLKPSSLARRKLQWDERLHAGKDHETEGIFERSGEEYAENNHTEET